MIDCYRSTQTPTADRLMAAAQLLSALATVCFSVATLMRTAANSGETLPSTLTHNPDGSRADAGLITIV